MYPPFFSVIVPTYNQARYLGAALESLLAQTDSDWEAVVINDGSTDSTPEVLQAYCEKDSRIRVFHKANGGVGSALNHGLEVAHGRWICWLSSDDLFEKNKLELHRDAISKALQCRFFFSHFRYLHEATGETTDPPLWHEVPDQRWQVIAMLKGSYIHGNSICVNREAWLKVGNFDECLRHGQDYDMWLRLLVAYPATFIPERTCITRWHAEQTTCSFPEMGFFDSAMAAINFLNRHRFEELFPLVDLTDPPSAKEALRMAMKVAADADSLFIYGLGPHPALVLRILEWAWSDCPSSIVGEIRRMARWWALLSCEKNRGSSLGFLCRCASVATGLDQRRFIYEPISPLSVAESYYWELKARGNPKADALSRYLEQRMTARLATGSHFPLDEVQDVVFATPFEMTPENPDGYGASRATLQIARFLVQSGIRVAVLGVSDNGLRLLDGVYLIGVSDEVELTNALRLWGPADVVVGISRADWATKIKAKRVLVYLHTQHPVPPFVADSILTQRLDHAQVPLLCVSRLSRDKLVSSGMNPHLVHIVPIGFDVEGFLCESEYDRPDHSLVFVGHIAGHNGFDIALKAFAALNIRVHDATFDAYGLELNLEGNRMCWSEVPNHLFEPRWLDEDGFPIWSTIEKDLPGFRYHTEVPDEKLFEVFKTHSLLVLPSRRPETLSLVTLKAQAMGCIPVLPRQGIFPENVQGEVAGFSCDDNSPQALCQKVTELWEKHLPTEEQRTLARDSVRANYSCHMTGSAVCRVMHSIPERRDRINIFYYRMWLIGRIMITFDSIINRFLRHTQLFRRALGMRRIRM